MPDAVTRPCGSRLSRFLKITLGVAFFGALIGAAEGLALGFVAGRDLSNPDMLPLVAQGALSFGIIGIFLGAVSGTIVTVLPGQRRRADPKAL